MVSNTMYSEDEDSQDDQFVNYKQKYRELKKNLRYLIYENECFQEELRKAQRNYVSISRDKSYLLDRILKYEKPQAHSSDSEATESSDEDDEAKLPQTSAQFMAQRKKITKRKRSEAEMQHNGNIISSSSEGPLPKQLGVRPLAGKPASQVKKPKKPPTARKPAAKKQEPKERVADRSQLQPQIVNMNMQVACEEQVNMESDMYDSVEYEFPSISGTQGHMTREEVERHLEARRYSPELNTTATVPAELFSHEADPESDFEDGEMCEFVQLEDDIQSAEMVIE